MNEWMNEWIIKKNKKIHEWINEWKNSRMNEKNSGMNKWIKNDNLPFMNILQYEKRGYKCLSFSKQMDRRKDKRRYLSIGDNDIGFSLEWISANSKNKKIIWLL